MFHHRLSSFSLFFTIIIIICATTLLLLAAPFVLSAPTNTNDQINTILKNNNNKRHLHFAVFCVPFYGHFLPVKSIAEQLVLSDHYVTVFAENMAWCESIAQRPSSVDHASELKEDAVRHKGLRCIEVPKSGTFNLSIFDHISTVHEPADSAGFTRLFDELAMHQKHQLKPIFAIAKKEHKIHPFDSVLYDISTFVGADVAAGLGGIPRIAVFPLVLTLAAAGVTPANPTHGTGFPRQLSVPQRALCSIQGWLIPLAGRFFVNKLHQNRLESGIPELQNKFYHDVMDFSVYYEPIIAPTIWGHDLGMPICPNVKPVGILEALPAPNTELEPELDELFTKGACKNAERVYINFGTLSVMNERMFTNLTQAVKMLLGDEENPTCVIWKLRADHELKYIENLVNSSQLPNSERLFVRRRFNDPQKILPLVHVFVSHCGDTSVGESINKLTPIAGLPFFADQIDVCARMEERGYGVHIRDKFTFTGQTVVDAVRSIGRRSAKRKDVEKAIREVRDVARWLGGAKEAARFVADIVDKNITRGFHCRHFNPNAFKHEVERTWGEKFQTETFEKGNFLRVFTQVLSMSDFDIHAVSGLILLFWVSTIIGFVRRLLFGSNKKAMKKEDTTVKRKTE